MKKFEKVCEWVIAIATTASGILGIVLLAKGKELPESFGLG